MDQVAAAVVIVGVLVLVIIIDIITWNDKHRA